MAKKETPAEDQQSFAAWLCQLGGGKTETELTDNLRELVQRVEETGKKGSLQLTISVQPLKANPDLVVVHDEIKLRKPEHDRKPSTFWQQDGALLRNDPNQRSIFDEITQQNVDVTTGEVED